MKVFLLATSLAFRGATLIDGTGAAPRENSLIVIRDGRVVSVAEATDAAVATLPPGTQVIGVSGKWIMPGLIDAHVHAESDQDLQTMLRWGVTSVRLMAEDVEVAARLGAATTKRTDVPDVFPVAPIFTAKGGWWGRGEPPASPGRRRRSSRRRSRPENPAGRAHPSRR